MPRYALENGQLVLKGVCYEGLNLWLREWLGEDYFRNAYGRDAGLRIDHLLLNPILAARLRKAGVDRGVRGWEKSSDHAPTWIELTMKQ